MPTSTGQTQQCGLIHWGCRRHGTARLADGMKVGMDALFNNPMINFIEGQISFGEEIHLIVSDDEYLNALAKKGLIEKREIGGSRIKNTKSMREVFKCKVCE